MSTKNANIASTKYPIIDNHKECGCCHIIFHISLFSKTSNTRNRIKGHKVGYRTNCKKCRSDQSYRYQMTKKIEAYPELYLDCENEECNWIFSKRRGKCPKCKETYRGK